MQVKSERPQLDKGILVLWNDDKGFGFVRPEIPGEDCFLHISALKKSGIVRRPAVGDIVFYRVAEDRPEKRRISYAVIEGVSVQEEKRSPAATLLANPPSAFLKVLIQIPLILSLYVIWRAQNPIPLIQYVFCSALTIFLYAADKKRALSGGWRIPEGYLHLSELLGGWPGALLAQNEFRHKIKKPAYQRVFWSIVALHGLGWLVFLISDWVSM